MRSLHALCQRVRGEIEGVHHTVGLQSEKSGLLRQAPGIVDGVVVPLPLQTEFRLSKIVALHDARLRLSAHKRTHLVGHLTVFVAQHRPSVDPATRHHRKHSTHTISILEDDAIPVARRGVDNRSLSLVGETAELTLQDYLLLIGSVDIISTIAHFTTVLARGIDV